MFADLVLSSALRKRTRYIAMMSLGIAMMLVAVAGSISKDEAAAIGAWAVGFLVLSVLLLGALGTTAVIGQVVGVVPRDVKTELADKSNKDTPKTSKTPRTSGTSNTPETPDANNLSDTERAFIRLLRNSDIPPDTVAAAILEVLERRKKG
jgi:hypothetical protein